MKRRLNLAVLSAALLGALALRAALAAEVYPAALPPEPAVRALLEAMPEVRAARARYDFDLAESERLRAGPNEWVLKATSQRRTDADAFRYREQGIGVERTVRWGGKSGKDAALAEQKREVAEMRLADAWHEAGRAFLRQWFDLLREQRNAAVLQAQLALQDEQAAVAQKRVRAGESPRMDLLLAEAERDKVGAAHYQAQQRAERALQALRQRFAGAALAVPDALPEPVAPGGDVESWTARVGKSNHEIGLAVALAEYARLAAQRSALDKLPDPTIGVHYQQERDRQERVVGLSISIPLPGGARSAQSAAAAAESVVAREQEAEARSRILREAADAARGAQAAYRGWQQLDALARRQQQAAALVGKAYALGEAGISDVLMARRQALEAESAAESARVDALQAHAALLLDAHGFWIAPGHDADGHEDH